MKNTTLAKKVLSFLLLSFIFLFMASKIQADWLDMAKEGGLEEIGQTAYQQDEPRDVRAMVVDIIIIILGTLGTVFVVLIIIAGFQWMTASGDSEKVDEAKDRIKNSVIGIVIILASYAIVNFVIKVILSSTQDSN